MNVYLKIFGAHVNILFIIKVNIIVLIKLSHRYPSNMMTIDPRTVIVMIPT